MTIERQRLVSLIELAQQAARVHSKPTATVAQHALPRFYEHELVTLPGVAFNFAAGGEEVWLAVDRRQETPPQQRDLHRGLFTLKQQLADAQLELVWGAGLGVWKCNGVEVSYPLLTQAVELGLNPVNGAMEVRPRDVESRLEIDWYACAGNPGVAEVEKAAGEFFAQAGSSFSPFELASYEALLRRAAVLLDTSGVYWPDHAPAHDRRPPQPAPQLRVTDTWVLFARPRTHDVLLRDLQTLKGRIESVTEVKQLPAAAALVSERSGDGAASANEPARRLYFPKPFNDEQVRIAQLLAASDGVAVRGPPGTGKTHTIANLICHWLAQGKRVLVTSAKEAALAGLRDQLPPGIRPLAIELLSSERQSIRKIEGAIQEITSELQALDRSALACEIDRIEERVDALHARLASSEAAIAEAGRRNMGRLAIDGEEIDPQDAAREVVDARGRFEWIPDALDIGTEFAPRFDDADIARLHEARRMLGDDIDYLGARAPLLNDFPDAQKLLEVHRDLLRFASLSAEIDKGAVPALADASEPTAAAAQKLLSQIEALHRLRVELERADRPWTNPVRQRRRLKGKDELFAMLEALGAELEGAMALRRAFIAKPVSAPVGIELDPIVVRAVRNLARGRSPFWVGGLLGKVRAGQKEALREIRIMNAPPADPGDWQHVAEYLELQSQLRALAVRWNSAAGLLGIGKVGGSDPAHGIAAAETYALYRKVVAVVFSEGEIARSAARIFPGWPHARETADSGEALASLEQALRHHVARNRLAAVWTTKESFLKGLKGKSGRIVEEIGRFFAETLGDPAVPDAQMQASWSRLTAELVRVQGLGELLASVEEITGRIADSGAPCLAAALRQPSRGSVAELLPEDWRKAWRLKRLATRLEAIDAGEQLKKSEKARRDIEAELASSYSDLVVKRAWLKLAETGPAELRTAQGAHAAAVLCWIMPQHRVSESLPAEPGCFDLVVIDEASQSDLTALPALLRARKLLIVGDDKQALAEDFCKAAFAKSTVMLREHFRCAPAIIEYSNREFYNHKLRPLRLPKASERLDPPLVDVLVQDGCRDGHVNLPEAAFIVEEIGKLVRTPAMAGRSIGVVSLLGDRQAVEIWQRLVDELGTDAIERHRITCGDARTFQGKERDIVFLSMMCGPNDKEPPLSRDALARDFNIAASRARDRMYLVRSVTPDQLGAADQLRRNLIAHFANPFDRAEGTVEDPRKLCESPLERELYDELVRRGYRVVPQVRVANYRIDLVVEGNNDSRLAVECDGDSYYAAYTWSDDLRAQRVLERAGWVFWRCFAANFVRRREAVIDDLVETLIEHGIEPIDADRAPSRVHSEHRIVSTMEIAADLRLARDPRFQVAPAGESQPGQAELRDFCARYKVPLEDRRHKAGRLWVYHFAGNDDVAARLKNWGFMFVPGKGYWHR